MLFTVVEFVKSFWLQMLLGLVALAGGKALSDEVMLKHPKGGASRLARFVLGFYFAVFFYGSFYFVATVARRAFER